MVAAAIVASISLEVSAVAAENSQKLSGSQIRAKFTGMQLTDEVHWRYVYDRDGTLRSYSMGTKRDVKARRIPAVRLKNFRALVE